MEYNLAMINMKKIISFVMTFLVICTVFTIMSCSKSNSKVEPKEDIDYISIPNGVIQYNTNSNMVTHVRFTVYNDSDKTLYYLKFRAQIHESESHILLWSDVYEAGSKTDMHQWIVEPGQTQNTELYPVDFYKYNWNFTYELLDAKFIE